MKLTIYSDLHLEFHHRNDYSMDIPEGDILILAGDIGIGVKPETYLNFLNQASEKYRQVLCVCGNHDHYKGKFPTTLNKINENIEHLDNVRYYNNESVVIDDVAFILSTLWSDFDNGDPLTLYYAKIGMNDFRIIRTGPKSEPWKRKFLPEDALAEFIKSADYIFEEIPKQKAAGNKTVVVTHHGCSFQSKDNRYDNDKLDGAYKSNLDDEILEHQPNLWVHGHLHASNDYMIDQTRVVTNPFGYYQYEQNNNFDLNKIIEI